MAPFNRLMQEHLARDWRADMLPEWRGFFADVGPDLDGLPDWDVPRVLPPRPAHERPQEAGGQLLNAHMTRAFDGLTPVQVRVVILGQDPYPRTGRATGRAFEDGLWNAENPMAVADSLRRLLQVAAAIEFPELEISEEGDDWGSVRDAVNEHVVAPPDTPTHFNALAGQGVLAVNSAWTFTGAAKNQKNEHLRIWRPVVHHLLRLLSESDLSTGFLLLGDHSRKVFCAADPILNHSAIIYNAHPRSRQFFNRSNPFGRVNQALVQLGSDPVRWWPRQNAEPEAHE
jgi:uracil-DNA glycosylase